MEIIVYIVISLLIALDVYLIIKLRKLAEKLDQKASEQQKKLSEAGDAITDTLRVAFDNLKRNNAEHNKINGKLNEYNSRIHRLEQHNNRNIRENLKKEDLIGKGKEYEDDE